LRQLNPSLDGTSASAPIFAGVVTLLNDARLNAGKSPLGFLNPMLYKAKSFDASAFYGSLFNSPIYVFVLNLPFFLF